MDLAAAEEALDRSTRVEAIAVSTGRSPGITPARVAVATSAHWTCGDCEQPCWCTGDARLMAHQPCGISRVR